MGIREKPLERKGRRPKKVSRKKSRQPAFSHLNSKCKGEDGLKEEGKSPNRGIGLSGWFSNSKDREKGPKEVQKNHGGERP